MGEPKNKFNNSNHRTEPNSEPTLFALKSNNMYRTSFDDMSKRVIIT